MTKFEQMLINKGYERFVLDHKTKTLIPTTKKTVGSLTNIDFRYKKDDIIIVFGLNEKNKPPTLISPRPKIQIIKDNLIYDEKLDDSMNSVLINFNHEIIYEAMFNQSIILKL